MSETERRLTTHQAGTLTRAFQHFELDRIIPMLWGSLPVRRRVQLTTNLQTIFTHAEQDGVNLLHPAADFHTWLRTPLTDTLRGPGTARPNTINTRYYSLKQLYDHLIREGLLTTNPTAGYALPPIERAVTPLPSPEDVHVLLTYLERHDPLLHAATTLIYHHALQYTELEALKWNAFDFSRGLLLRPRTETKLSKEALHALQPLLKQAGGPLHTQDSPKAIFPFENRDAFRLPLWRACKVAGIGNISPRELRLCSLRDHAHTPSDVGFVNAESYRRAIKHAEDLAERLSGE